MVSELQNVRSNCSTEVVDIRNCLVLIILYKAAASIPTIKPSSTRRDNAVSVVSINAYEELETEFQAFLTPAIHGDNLSGRV